jgi:hypothetical protein
MRLKFVLCGVTTLMPVLLLAGCSMDQMSMSTPTANLASPAISGRSFGGQQPVTGSTISVVEMGTSGYGSTGIVLASTITDSNGNFSFAPNAYTCPQSDTPVYLMGIGGNAGAGSNSSAVEAAALGTCSNAKNSFVVMNEVTTAATAFVLSHFFSTTLGGSNGANDWFGGPSTTSGGTTTYSQGLVMGSEVTIPMIVTTALGTPNQGQNGSTVEWQKINTIANILAACINSSGSTSSTETKTTCGKLFNYTKNGATTRPSDTLQAAVMMALFPATEVSNLYNLISGTPAFSSYLTTAPNDWSIGVSFTSSSLGLAVDTGTLTTLDIDSSGRIWFPSNAAGAVGLSYFDPTSQSFNGPYNSTGLVHPQQVAIDANGVAWLNDSSASSVPGYSVAAPTGKVELVSLPGSVSNAVTVGGDDRVNVGVTDGGVFEIANISADRSGYALDPGISFAFSVASIAGDTSDGDAVAITNPTTTQMRSYYVSATPAETDIVNANDDAGQVIYTGNDYISVRSYSGTGNAVDGVCIYSQAKCYNLQGAMKNTDEGMVIDGGKNLWIAESGDGGVLQVPVNNPGAADGAIYLNSSGASNVPNNELLHGTGNGGTATAPYGIGVDATGNVWVTNAGCAVNDCTPGSFTLTEIVGAGYPTITPVSAQITTFTNRVGTEPTN